MFGMLFNVISPRLLKYGIMAIGIVSIVGYVYIKINSLNSEILDLQVSVKQLESKLDVKRLELMNKNNVIATLNSSINDMTSNIDKSNKIIEQQAIDIQASKTKLKIWMNKPPKIRYKTIYHTIHSDTVDYNKATCKQGLQLNKDISGMKYENF